MESTSTLSLLAALLAPPQSSSQVLIFIPFFVKLQVQIINFGDLTASFS